MLFAGILRILAIVLPSLLFFSIASPITPEDYLKSSEIGLYPTIPYQCLPYNGNAEGKKISLVPKTTKTGLVYEYEVQNLSEYEAAIAKGDDKIQLFVYLYGSPRNIFSIKTHSGNIFRYKLDRGSSCNIPLDRPGAEGMIAEVIVEPVSKY